MFTGIVQAVVKVKGFEGGRLTLEAPSFIDEPWAIGESVAVSGCCLTLVDQEGGLAFDLSPETLARTSLGALRTGSAVNLERAMRPSDRFGGHIVQGHVDGIGRVVSVRPEGESWVFRFACEGSRYLIDKGSVTIDGVSLTVVRPEGGEFDVWVIPHTYAHTSLHQRAAGDPVNLEYDVLAKYVERLLAARDEG